MINPQKPPKEKQPQPNKAYIKKIKSLKCLKWTSKISKNPLNSKQEEDDAEMKYENKD